MSGPPLKLAVISSHPVQYYAPVFRALAQRRDLELRVFFTWSQAGGAAPFDHGFGAEVKWDVPLLEGYAHQFVRNDAADPGTHHFRGLVNPTLAAEIESWGAHAVLVYGWNSASHLQALRHFKGRVPVLFRGDSTLLDGTSWGRKLLRRAFLRWVYSHIDMAIAVGSNNRDYFRWCGVPAERISQAPHSVDTIRFGADATDQEKRAEDWRRSLGIESDAVVFLYAGKLQKKKNPELLLEAFLRLQRGYHLIFAGSGEMDTRLKARAAAHANVHFLPFQNQSVMPLVYRLGDVFVLPSQGPGETWGLALNEAMAVGRPMIASSKVGAALDLIRPGVSGWMFESGDCECLKRVMTEAANHRRDGLRVLGRHALTASVRWSTEESARGIGAAVLQASAAG